MTNTATEIMARLDRLADALEAQQRGPAPRTAAERQRVPTFGEQVRACAAEACDHGEPRGRRYCPLCRRGEAA